MLTVSLPMPMDIFLSVHQMSCIKYVHLCNLCDSWSLYKSCQILLPISQDFTLFSIINPWVKLEFFLQYIYWTCWHIHMWDKRPQLGAQYSWNVLHVSHLSFNFSQHTFTALASFSLSSLEGNDKEGLLEPLNYLKVFAWCLFLLQPLLVAISN